MPNILLLYGVFCIGSVRHARQGVNHFWLASMSSTFLTMESLFLLSSAYTPRMASAVTNLILEIGMAIYRQLQRAFVKKNEK